MQNNDKYYLLYNVTAADTQTDKLLGNTKFAKLSLPNLLLRILQNFKSWFFGMHLVKNITTLPRGLWKTNYNT